MAGLFAFRELPEATMGDTAVADLPAPASPVAEPPSTDKVTPETSQQTEPETREQEQTPDSGTTEPNEEPETLTRAEHEAALKAERAKAEESYRRKEENARNEAKVKALADNYSQREISAQRARMGRADSELRSMLAEAHEAAAKEARENGLTIPPLQVNEARIRRLVLDLDNMAFHGLHQMYSAELNSLIGEFYPDYTIPREKSEALVRAEQSYEPKAMVRARHDIYLDAVLSDLTPKTRAKVLEELDQEDSETAKEAAMRKAEAERKGAQRPTATPGAPGKARTPRQILDDPNSSVEERKKALLAETGYQL